MPQQPAPTPTPDAAPLVSEFADDQDMLELVEMFVDELPQRVDALHSALGDARYDELARLAHQLKGAGGGYGFPDITTAGAQLEGLAKSASSGEADAVSNLQQAADELTDLCRRATAGG